MQANILAGGRRYQKRGLLEMGPSRTLKSPNIPRGPPTQGLVLRASSQSNFDDVGNREEGIIARMLSIAMFRLCAVVFLIQQSLIRRIRKELIGPNDIFIAAMREIALEVNSTAHAPQ